MESNISIAQSVSKVEAIQLRYSIPFAYCLWGPQLNVERLEHALRLLLHRHEALRTVLQEEGHEGCIVEVLSVP